MTLVMPTDRGESWCPQIQTCWYCDESLPRNVVAAIWYTAPSAILLHPSCSRRLGVHLIGDSREAELVSRRQPGGGGPRAPWEPRTRPPCQHLLAARHRLGALRAWAGRN